MAFNFPNTPTLGEIANGYNWDGEKWNVGVSFDGSPMDFPSSPTVGYIAYGVYEWDGEKWNTEDFQDGTAPTEESGPIGLLFLMMGMRDG